MSSKWLVGSASLALSWSMPAAAQDPSAGQPSATAEARSAEADQPGDIVVTARKREERLSDVPISISAIGEVKIEREGVANIDRVAQLTPGLQLDKGAAPADSRPSLRGIPLIEGRSNVAIIIDGIDVTGISLDRSFGGSSSFFSTALLDLARVEVVKGPQSVYFGRSAFSGAIQFVSKDPGDTLEGKINASVGNRDLVEGSFHVGGPVAGDILKVKVSGLYRRFGGFYRNPGNRARFADERSYGGAATAVFTPSPDVSITGRLSYLDQHVGPPPIYAVTQASFGTDLRITSDKFNRNLIQQNANYDFEGSRNRIWRTSLNLKARLNDDFNMSLLTGYNRVKGTNGFDFDRTNAQTPVGIPGAGGSLACVTGVCVAIYEADIRLKQFSQEGRLFWDGASGLSAMVGAYYFKERFNQFEYNRFVSSQAFVGPTRANISPRLVQSFTTSYAFFGSLAYKPVERLTLTAELRYNHERINQRAPAFDDLAQTGSLLQTLGGDQTFVNYNPRFSVDYKLPDNQTLLYASAARGSKPGGVNLVVISDAFRSYDEESIWTYEAGVKTKLLDNRLTLDLAGYYSDYKDAQISSFCFGRSSPLGPEPECPLAPQAQLNYIINAGLVRIKGIDLTTEYRPIDWLRLSLTYAYTSSIIKDLVTRNAVSGAARVQYRGNRMPLIPRHSIVGTIGIERNVTDQLKLFGSFTTRYRSSRFARFDNRFLLDAKTLLDAQLGLETGGLQLTAFVNNLTNNTAPDWAREGPVFNPLRPLGVQIAAPDRRTFGLRGTYRF